MGDVKVKLEPHDARRFFHTPIVIVILAKRGAEKDFDLVDTITMQAGSWEKLFTNVQELLELLRNDLQKPGREMFGRPDSSGGPQQNAVVRVLFFNASVKDYLNAQNLTGRPISRALTEVTVGKNGPSLWSLHLGLPMEVTTVGSNVKELHLIDQIYIRRKRQRIPDTDQYVDTLEFAFHNDRRNLIEPVAKRYLQLWGGQAFTYKRRRGVRASYSELGGGRPDLY